MRRFSVSVRGLLIASTAFIASAGTFALAQDASQDGPPAASAKPGGSAPPAAAANSSPSRPTQGKILYTIPEDGMGSNELVPASSRLVRDEVAAHPGEDLIICLAGCRPGPDRIVYSQPADAQAGPTTPAPEANAESQIPQANSPADVPKAKAAAAEPAPSSGTARLPQFVPTNAPSQAQTEKAAKASEKAEPAAADAPAANVKPDADKPANP
jgi:hypothetical protein